MLHRPAPGAGMTSLQDGGREVCIPNPLEWPKRRPWHFRACPGLQAAARRMLNF